MNITYPDLPISRRRNDILAALREHQVMVVVGETGSGKTTQLPKMAMELAGDRPGRVGCTQPRRLAAASVSRRVAEELGCELGGLVGYQVRFEEKAGPDTRLKFMTDGILLAETQHDPDLRQYHTLILDEAHERSLNIDFLLGYLKLLLDRRPDLKLVISSATLDAGGFSEFFNGAPIVQEEARTYPGRPRGRACLSSRRTGNTGGGGKTGRPPVEEHAHPAPFCQAGAGGPAKNLPSGAGVQTHRACHECGGNVPDHSRHHLRH